MMISPSRRAIVAGSVEAVIVTGLIPQTFGMVLRNDLLERFPLTDALAPVSPFLFTVTPLPSDEPSFTFR